MQKKLVVSFYVLGLALAACGGGQQQQQQQQSAPPNEVNAPEWVMKGSGAFNANGKKAFWGVGSASGIKNHSLAMSTADNRARAELTKTFEVYSASLMKDYMASTTAGDMSASSEEQHVEQAIKTFAAQTLSGVTIVDHWFHPDGTVYSLAMLDLERMQELATESKELSPQVRDTVRQHAQQAFDALDAQVEKKEAAAAGGTTP